jgi:hypothetical protein
MWKRLDDSSILVVAVGDKRKSSVHVKTDDSQEAE